MTPLSVTLGAALVPFNQDIPDPEDVTAGGVGAVVLVLLALAVVVLILSFRKQLKKVRFDQPEGHTEQDEDAPEQPENGGSYKP
ncbi:MAG: hypothetical protein ACOYX5_02725 [Actinomycetota bacterium]